MPFSETGIFTPAVDFVPDSPATAQDMNALSNDIANGLSACQTLAGLSVALANWKMGGYKLTGLGPGSQTGDSVSYEQIFGSSGLIPAGSVMLFGQAAAPVGWTQVTTLNDYALRVVSGAGGASHGTVGLSSFIANGTASHALVINEMPSHGHPYTDPTHEHGYAVPSANPGGYQNGGGTNNFFGGNVGETTSASGIGITINNTGGGAGHTHGLLDLAYFDLIQCSKN